MHQIISKIKADVQVVLPLSCFVRHPPVRKGHYCRLCLFALLAWISAENLLISSFFNWLIKNVQRLGSKFLNGEKRLNYLCSVHMGIERRLESRLWFLIINTWERKYKNEVVRAFHKLVFLSRVLKIDIKIILIC